MTTSRVSAASHLDYQEIRYRLQNHAVFRLLRKERAAFILAFLISAFKTRQRSDIPESELVTELSSYIDMLRLTVGEGELTLDARASLEDWANTGSFAGSIPPVPTSHATTSPRKRSVPSSGCRASPAGNSWMRSRGS